MPKTKSRIKGDPTVDDLIADIVNLNRKWTTSNIAKAKKVSPQAIDQLANRRREQNA